MERRKGLLPLSVRLLFWPRSRPGLRWAWAGEHLGNVSSVRLTGNTEFSLTRNRLLVSLFAGLVCSCRLSFAAIEIQGQRVIADTPNGRAVIERGVITELTNRLTGETYTTGQAQTPLCGLLWHGKALGLDAHDRVICEQRGPNAARISTVQDDGRQMTMTVTLDPATGDLLIRQSGSAQRKGLYGIQWGIAGLDSTRLRTIVPGDSGLCLDQRFPAASMQFNWPMSWEAQMVVAEGAKGAKGGFWVWSQDADMQFKALTWAREKGQVALGFQSHNHAPFDDLKSVESVEWRLAFFAGDWRVPAKRYREWMEQSDALAHLDLQQPAWAKDIRFVAIIGADAKTLDLLKAQVPPAATLLYCPGWRQDGYDQNYPDYTAAADFAAYVRYAHALGFRVMPHMNYFGCHERHPAYARFQPFHMKNPFTKALEYWVPPRARAKKDEFIPQKFAYINPASKAWRDELTLRLVAAQRQYGFDAIHLDQTLCIVNDANGQIDGTYCPQGNLLLHRQLREALPGIALSGEGLDEVTCRYEAFAQRHAPLAVDHSFGSWNDEYIACGHPLSSYLLAPYTKPYGYLGMANPSSSGLYLAWKRAYANWGVLPTFARPSAAQLAHPNDLVQALFKETRVWVEDQLSPAFEGSWSPDVQFRLQGTNGATVLYKNDPLGGSQMTRSAAGHETSVYTLLRGRRDYQGAGSIAGWLAYDAEKLFGLDPDQDYLYLAEPRDLRATHIARVPADTLVRVLACDQRKFVAELVSRPENALYDFIKEAPEAETGVEVDGKRSELADGGTFMPGTASCGEVVRRCLFAHPPYKTKSKGPEPARTFGRYRLALPADQAATLEFAIGLRDGVDGRSDGVQFRVEVDGQPVYDELWSNSVWKSSAVPLAKWRGKNVSLAFVTTPGPKHNGSFDWACWGEPHIRFDALPRRGDVSLISSRSVPFVLASDPRHTARQRQQPDGLSVCDVNLELPGQVILLWDKPKPVALPLNLAAEPFELAFAVNGSPAKLPLPNAGAKPGAGASNGVTKKGVNAHPPDHGRTSMDYFLELPAGKPATLSFAAGLRDGAKSDGVLFIVEANGKELYRQQVTRPDGWHPATVDLAPYAGQPLLLSLVVDADGPFNFDWATWAEPMIR